MVKKLPANAGGVRDLGSIPWEDPLEKRMATHSNILAWRIPWTEEPGRLQSIGLQGVRHNRSSLHTRRQKTCTVKTTKHVKIKKT